jgi:hypothetical protein
MNSEQEEAQKSWSTVKLSTVLVNPQQADTPAWGVGGDRTHLREPVTMEPVTTEGQRDSPQWQSTKDPSKISLTDCVNDCDYLWIAADKSFQCEMKPISNSNSLYSHYMWLYK